MVKNLKSINYIKSFIVIYLLTFFLPHVSYCQIDTSKIKITSHSVHKCIKQINDSNDSEFENENSNPDDSLTIYTDYISISYPIVETRDRDLNKFINDTIMQIVGEHINNEDSADDCQESNSKQENIPAVWNSSFETTFVDPNYLSFIFSQDDYAGAGGNGSEHLKHPVTFDLKHKTIPVLADIVNKSKINELCEIISKMIKEDHAEFFGFYNNEEGLKNIRKILDQSFALDKQVITFFWNLSYGHGTIDVDLSIDFKNYKKYFDKKFLKDYGIN